MRDACSKRTSATVRCLQELTARAFVRLGTRPELVEGEQGGAGDRRRGGRMDGEGGAQLAETRLDRAEQVAVAGAEETTPEDDLGRPVDEVETLERDTRHRHDLVCQPL